MKNVWCSAFILFVVFFKVLVAENGLPLSNTDGGASTIVDNCVSVITGDYMESSCDLFLQGPESLIFERFYSSGDHDGKSLYAGFRHNHESEITTYVPEETNQIEAVYTNKNGRQAKYFGKMALGRLKSSTLKYQEHFGKGYTNCGSQTISARNHIKNTSLIDHADKSDLKVSGENGSELYFSCYSNSDINGRKFHLSKETTSSKNTFEYQYKSNCLSLISCKDSSGKVLFGSVYLKYLKDKELKINPVLEVEAHDGRKVIYKLEEFKENRRKYLATSLDKYRIRKVLRPNAPYQGYEYHKNSLKIAKKKMPGGRFLNVEYFGKGEKPYSYGKVFKLSAPVGHDSQPVKTYSFAYDKISDKRGKLHKGLTYVWNAKNDLTAYVFDSEMRLETVEKYRGSSKKHLYSTENFYWSHEGNLLCHAIKDEHQKIWAARAFKYDPQGNVLEDSFYGNLQGGIFHMEFDEVKKRPHQKGCNSWTVFYRYSKDGRNLIEEECYQNGKSIEYTYEKNRDLMISKLTLEHGKIRIREFCEYDAFGLQSCKIVDDGSSKDRNNLTNVTERKIVKIENQSHIPIGLPKIISEYYLDLKTKKEILLKRIKNSYCNFGNLALQEVYNANEELVASNRFEYDSHGNIVLEEDIEKNQTIKAYNKNDELILEEKVYKNESRHLTYDFAGRLIKEENHLSDGTNLSSSYHYDYLGNKIASIDSFGQKTEYVYDAFSRLIKTTFPNYIDPLGKAQQMSISKEYDIFGNETASISPSGAKTVAEYNARGKPIHICYPEGSVERFLYQDDGALSEAIAKNGSRTLFVYDAFGRVLKEETYSKEGLFLSGKSFYYNSFHKIEEEINGQKTLYAYTPFGKLKSIRKDNSFVEYEYDASQRIAKEKTWVNQQSYQAKIFIYDLLNRVIEEKILDESDQLLSRVRYSYDKAGNKIEEVRGEGSVLKTVYNGEGKPVQVIDPEGNSTYFTYNREFYNKHGQYVLQVLEDNSLGIQTITEMNILGKPDSVIKKNSLGEILSKKEIGYDADQNISFVKETVIGGKERPDILTKYFYNKENSLILLIEAFGTKEQKTTEFCYNASGQEIATKKPDGTAIEKTYDALNRLQSLKASNGSFSYAFEYDSSGHLSKSHDLVIGKTVERSYDTLGNLLTENFGNGIIVKYSYDFIGRPLLVVLPDDSSVSYTYDALHLKKCKRVSKNGKTIFSHDYLSYDLAGHLLEEKNSCQSGISRYQYNLNGYLEKTESDLFSEEIRHDALGNIIRIKREGAFFDEENSYSYDDLKQLKEEKGLFTHTYQHDSLNNCITQDGKEKKVNSLNQLLEADGKTYSYDANGNRLSDGEKEYQYDALDRLVLVSFKDEVYVYAYDSFNRRLSKTHKNKEGSILDEEFYLYFGQNEVGSYDKDLHLKEFRMLGTGKGAEIGASLLIELNSSSYFTLHDYHGNIIALVDVATLEVKEHYHYSAFGKEKFLNNPVNPWRFSSKRVDPETGFSNFGRRYYDSETMRWLSPDPIGFEGGPNLYAYVMNNPLSLYDLYGLEAVGNNQRWSIGRVGRTIKDAVNYCIRNVNHFIQRTVSFTKDLFKSPSEKVYYDRNYEDSLKQQSRNIPINSYNPSPIQGIRIGLINGICNSEEDALANAKIVHEIAGDVDFALIYKQTYGLGNDISATAKSIIGNRATKASKCAYEDIVPFLMKNPDGHYLLICHSGGTNEGELTLKLLPKEFQQRVHVLAIAPGTYIDRSLCGSVQHFVSTRDIVPLFNLKGRIACRDTVKVLTPHQDAPLFDHSFSSPTYRDPIKGYVDKFIDKYGK